jgi:DNA-binding NarL/FixJ family response regulator
MNRLQILLADDHAVVRAGLRALIDAQPDMQVGGEAGDGVEVVTLVDDLQPDLVVMDLSMPRMNGIEATKAIRLTNNACPILVLSVHDDATYLRLTLEAGATGYVLKRTAAETLIAAIRQVATGQVYLDPALSAVLVQTVAGEAAPIAGDLAELSERETSVLRMIAQGFSNKEIAANLSLSVKTIETYKTRAMEKLGIASRVEIVRYAVANGWLNQN